MFLHSYPRDSKVSFVQEVCLSSNSLTRSEMANGRIIFLSLIIVLGYSFIRNETGLFVCFFLGGEGELFI